VPLQQVIDIEKEKRRLQNELETAKSHQITLEKKIKNKQFTSNAPEHVVNATKEKINFNREKIKKIKDFIASLK
jgi:valyl-tRNA synthetase